MVRQAILTPNNALSLAYPKRPIPFLTPSPLLRGGDMPALIRHLLAYIVARLE